MIPAPFEYELAASRPAHALDLLAEHGDEAKLLAGGHSLLPMMKLRLAVPSVLIDIGRLTELAGIAIDGDELVIGATTRHADVAGSELVRVAGPAAGLRPRGRSATRRSATGARSAARWRTPTRPPTCPWRWSRWAARWS